MTLPWRSEQRTETVQRGDGVEEGCNLELSLFMIALLMLDFVAMHWLRISLMVFRLRSTSSWLIFLARRRLATRALQLVAWDVAKAALIAS